MRLLIDGDACPDKNAIKTIAIQYQIEMIVYIDYAHMLEDDYYQIIECAVGRDSVDMAIVHDAKAGDLVITQDYGLASLLLGKGAKVLHVSGMIIDAYNIDLLLASRYISAKHRKAGHRVKGPAKRTDEIRRLFLNHLEEIVKKQTIHKENE